MILSFCRLRRNVLKDNTLKVGQHNNDMQFFINVLSIMSTCSYNGALFGTLSLCSFYEAKLSGLLSCACIEMERLVRG